MTSVVLLLMEKQNVGPPRRRDRHSTIPPALLLSPPPDEQLQVWNTLRIISDPSCLPKANLFFRLNSLLFSLIAGARKTGRRRNSGHAGSYRAGFWRSGLRGALHIRSTFQHRCPLDGTLFTDRYDNTYTQLFLGLSRFSTDNIYALDSGVC